MNVALRVDVADAIARTPRKSSPCNNYHTGTFPKEYLRLGESPRAPQVFFIVWIVHCYL
jgi:hypothetical protein